jgi:hypothetical protein
MLAASDIAGGSRTTRAKVSLAPTTGPLTMPDPSTMPLKVQTPLQPGKGVLELSAGERWPDTNLPMLDF